MSNPESDVIDLLSTNMNLISGGVWTSNKVQLLEYSSINILVKCDQNLSIQIQFSDDGTNFDYLSSENYVAPTGTTYAETILAKWVRLMVTNSGGSTSTYLRLFTYASVTNTVTSVTFAPEAPIDVTITGQPIDVVVTGQPIDVVVTGQPLDVNATIVDQPISVSLANESYGLLTTVGLVPFFGSQLNFTELKNYTAALFSSSPSAGIDFLLKWESTIPAECYYATINNYLSLVGFTVASTVGGFSRFTSNYVTPIRAGQAISAVFSAMFRNQYADAVNNYDSTDYIGLGVPSAAGSSTWESGFSLGQGTPVNWISAGIYSKFRITTWSSGTPTHIYQRDFNVDTLDGNGPSGIVLNWKLLNVYAITYGYVGCENVTFSIYNSTTGLYTPFHIIRSSNSSLTPIISPVGGRFIMSSLNESGALSLNLTGPSSAGFATFIQTGSDGIVSGYSNAYNRNLSTATTETLIYSLKNPVSFQSKSMLVPIKIGQLASSNLSSTDILTIRIYKNCTFTVAPVWVDVNSVFTPMQYDNTGTINVFTQLIAIYNVSPKASINANIEDIILNSDETISITGSLSGGVSSTCSYSLMFHEYF